MSTEDKLRAQFPDLELAKLPPPHQHPHYNACALESASQLLPKGHVKKENLKSFPADVIFERDTAIQMRDGALIYTDIFRPAIWQKRHRTTNVRYDGTVPSWCSSRTDIRL